MAGTTILDRGGNSREGSLNLWRAILSAFCASLIGIGLARFAYTPLLPAIVDARWFEASTAAYLGAANLAGYLAGALMGRPMAGRFSTVATLRAMMALATLTFFACSYPFGFAWFFAWRFAAGLAGGVLMVLAAPTVLTHIAPARRGLAGGAIFMGIGAGIAASGTLVPLLLQQGLRQAWLGLGALSLLLMAAAWSGWPRGENATARPAASGHAPRTASLRALYAEYALNAAGWVPHMIFLVDFVARGLGEGVEVGALYWTIFGIGATIGPLLAGHLADRIGFGAALRMAFLLEAVAVALPAGMAGQAWLIGSSLIVGAFVTGTVPLVIGRIHELLPHHPAQQKRAWSLATVWFALFQAGAAYALSFLFAQSGGNYRLLFVIGAAAMILALAIDLVANGIGRPGNEGRQG
ncbi:YbfB/YjiJ family MFS transporter [Labrys sp. 22185]|uniref:YbfB/YjiJ family MFS transporter n=1 Tax=Labrys sp. 22185 TaxID=3453888 RepID=UPI003F848DA9